MSLINLEGEVYLDIKINDQDPPSMMGFLDEIQIVESVSNLVPTLAMTVNDLSGVLTDQIGMKDGLKLSITIGQSPEEVSDNQAKHFRLFSYAGQKFQSGYKYQLSGIFDAPKFTVDVDQGAYKGTSVSVLEEIANKAGIDWLCDVQTDDFMTWLNVGDSLSTFARKVAKHSFLSDGLMQLCCYADNTLVFVDVLAALNKKSEYRFVSSEVADSPEQTWMMNDWIPSSSAGFFNSWLNYGYSFVECKLDGIASEHSSIQLNTGYANSSVSDSVTGMIDVARRDYAPIDCGNTHEHYWEAYHANMRRAALFNQCLKTIIPTVTNLNPLECLLAECYNSNSGKLNNHSGKYLVSAKKTIVRGTKYAELFELLRPGSN